MNDILFAVVRLALTVILAVIARYLVPWIRTSLAGSRYQLAASIVSDLVQAVEQTLVGSGRGDEKYDFVLRLAKKALERYHVEMTDEQLSALIESAVWALKDVIVELPVAELDSTTPE